MSDRIPEADAPLPEDPDLDVAETAAGDPHTLQLHPAHLMLAFIGGTLGTAARAAVMTAIPASQQIPWSVWLCNVAGAFLLGALLEVLARRGPDQGRRRTLRLILGTGFMGGFTTYSALAADTAVLIGTGSAGVGIGYGLATVVAGGVLTWIGILAAGWAHRANQRRSR